MDFIPKYNKNNKANNLDNNNLNIDVKKTKEYLDLQNLLKEEKEKNDKLNSQIELLNNKYNKLNEELENAKRTINDLNTKLSNYKNQYKEKIVELQKIIDIKNQEINQLNSRINNNSSGMIFMPGDKIISIVFISGNQKIQYYNRAYKDTEIFSRVEEKLYNEYPEFKDKDTYLMVRGNKIKRFKTLKENNIKNGDVIQVHIYDEEF